MIIIGYILGDAQTVCTTCGNNIRKDLEGQGEPTRIGEGYFVNVYAIRQEHEVANPHMGWLFVDTFWRADERTLVKCDQCDHVILDLPPDPNGFDLAQEVNP